MGTIIIEGATCCCNTSPYTNCHVCIDAGSTCTPTSLTLIPSLSLVNQCYGICPGTRSAKPTSLSLSTVVLDKCEFEDESSCYCNYCGVGGSVTISIYDGPTCGAAGGESIIDTVVLNDIQWTAVIAPCVICAGNLHISVTAITENVQLGLPYCSSTTEYNYVIARGTNSFFVDSELEICDDIDETVVVNGIGPPLASYSYGGCCIGCTPGTPTGFSSPTPLITVGTIEVIGAC